MDISDGYIWWIHLVDTSGGYLWWIHLVDTSGGYLWWIHLVDTSGDIRAACVAGQSNFTQPAKDRLGDLFSRPPTSRVTYQVHFADTSVRQIADQAHYLIESQCTDTVLTSLNIDCIS